MRAIFRLISLLLLLSVLTACQYQTTLPGRSEVPIYKPPQVQTPTPSPTATPEPPDYIQTGSPVQVSAGMYSFEPVTVWDESGEPLRIDIKDTRVTLSNAQETLFFSLASEPAPSGSTTQACLDTILQRMAADLSDLAYSEPAPLATQAGTGLQVQLQAKVFSQTSIWSSPSDPGKSALLQLAWPCHRRKFLLALGSFRHANHEPIAGICALPGGFAINVLQRG